MAASDLVVTLGTIGVLLWLGATTARVTWRVRLLAGASVLALTGWHVLG